MRADDGGIEFQVRYRGEQRRFRPEQVHARYTVLSCGKPGHYCRSEIDLSLNLTSQIVGMLLTKLNATVADKTGAKIGELVISVSIRQFLLLTCRVEVLVEALFEIS